LQDSLLEQIPFLGKNSKPPTIRSDVWTPLLTVFFPNGNQGLAAYRLLREFRRLHETCWDKQYPEILRMEKKKRIHWIKDQKANSIADLAKVLSMFKTQAPKLENLAKEKRKQVEAIAKRRWAAVEKLAAAANGGELVKIEGEIERLKKDRESKGGEKELERIDKAINNFRARYALLKKSQRQVVQFKAEEARIAKEKQSEGKPAEGKTAEGKTAEGKTAEGKTAEGKSAEGMAAEGMALIATEEVTAASGLTIIEEGDKLPKYSILPQNSVLAKVVPVQHRKALPAPMSVDGVIVQWAQLTDAEHALGSWPKEVLHAEMGFVRRHPPLPEHDAEEFPLNEEESEALGIAKAEQRRRAREAQEAEIVARRAAKEAKSAERAKEAKRNAGILGRLGFTKLPLFGAKEPPRRATLEQQ
jgi:uncharacterized low-complexity protein